VSLIEVVEAPPLYSTPTRRRRTGARDANNDLSFCCSPAGPASVSETFSARKVLFLAEKETKNTAFCWWRETLEKLERFERNTWNKRKITFKNYRNKLGLTQLVYWNVKIGNQRSNSGPMRRRTEAERLNHQTTKF